MPLDGKELKLGWVSFHHLFRFAMPEKREGETHTHTYFSCFLEHVMCCSCCDLNTHTKSEKIRFILCVLYGHLEV